MRRPESTLICLRARLACIDDGNHDRSHLVKKYKIGENLSNKLILRKILFYVIVTEEYYSLVMVWKMVTQNFQNSLDSCRYYGNKHGNEPDQLWVLT